MAVGMKYWEGTGIPPEFWTNWYQQKWPCFFLPEPTLLQTIMLDIQPLAFGEGNGYYYTSKSWMLKKKTLPMGFLTWFLQLLGGRTTKKKQRNTQVMMKSMTQNRCTCFFQLLFKSSKGAVSGSLKCKATEHIEDLCCKERWCIVWKTWENHEVWLA